MPQRFSDFCGIREMSTSDLKLHHDLKGLQKQPQTNPDNNWYIFQMFKMLYFWYALNFYFVVRCWVICLVGWDARED